MVVGHVELKARQLATSTESEGVRTLVGVLITHSGREHTVVSVFQTTRKQGFASIFRGEITTRKGVGKGVLRGEIHGPVATNHYRSGQTLGYARIVKLHRLTEIHQSRANG